MKKSLRAISLFLGGALLFASHALASPFYMATLYGVVPVTEPDPWYVTWGRIILWVLIPIIIIILAIRAIVKRNKKK